MNVIARSRRDLASRRFWLVVDLWFIPSAKMISALQPIVGLVGWKTIRKNIETLSLMQVLGGLFLEAASGSVIFPQLH
jgi:hypothetical protein